ncbi:cell division-specific peptidoglycan biosynthesis regulator FtsW [Raineyella antarctica]|uniref:Probable peptidoglycan glycosyltransferase FtsW n=1 Tax=Raineyella antarctica TaxID=1577474 RepID=A0A1G6GDU0_9ACTN|nr:putative lipid II flippase FtsW [Raineyella antarctica]SDB80161.1 cell division-specific peptidoglycan biosynthesis regulator FtsW [Raineyella antarctica]
MAIDTRDLAGDTRDWVATTSATVRGWLDHPRASQALLATSVGLLLFVGSMMVLSASSVLSYVRYDGNSYAIFLRQLGFLVVGLVAAVVLSVVPPERFRRASVVLYGVALVGLLATYTPLGYEVNGNRNWLHVGPLNGQPSEFAKLAIMWWGAHILARYDRELDQLRRVLWPYLVANGLLVGLTVLQGDLGSAVIMAAIIAVVLWVAGVPLRFFAFFGIAAGGVVGALIATTPYRIMRMLAFLRPQDTITDANYQTMMGTYALASGGWWGLNLGASRQKWGGLPEAHTDYIMAILGEELGLFGTLAVVALFALLGWAGVRIMRRSVRPYQRYLAAGATGWIIFQAFINIAVVLRLWPVMGVPLPFISYGGSSVVATLMAVGLLMSCARAEPGAIAERERRARAQAHQQSIGRVSAVVDGRVGAVEHVGQAPERSRSGTADRSGNRKRRGASGATARGEKGTGTSR